MNTLTHAALLGLIAMAGTAQADTLFDNGPVVNGAGISSIMTGGTTFGFAAASGANRVADDFSVTGADWTITNLDLFSYQTGSAAFTFTSATWSIVSNDPSTGTVMASGTATPVTNGGQVGFRTSASATTNTDRRIFRVGVDIPDMTLAAGSYWLIWSLTGTGSSGPWVPPTSDGRVGNAFGSVAATGALASATDPGSGQRMDLPFVLYGTVAAVPEPANCALMLMGGAVLLAARRRRDGRG